MKTKDSGGIASEKSMIKNLSMKDKCRDLGMLVSKFTGSKKITKTPLAAVASAKMQKNLILTPKGASKVSFHPKSRLK